MKTTPKSSICALACSAVLTFAGASHAQGTQEGPTVENATMKIGADLVMNAATGDNANATQNIGSIESGNVNSLNVDVAAEKAMNAATGKDTCADQAIGTIGHKSACSK